MDAISLTQTWSSGYRVQCIPRTRLPWPGVLRRPSATQSACRQWRWWLIRGHLGMALWHEHTRIYDMCKYLNLKQHGDKHRYICVYAMHIFIYCMHVCMYVCVYVCMYVCIIYLYLYACILIYWHYTCIHWYWYCVKENAIYLFIVLALNAVDSVHLYQVWKVDHCSCISNQTTDPKSHGSQLKWNPLGSFLCW